MVEARLVRFHCLRLVKESDVGSKFAPIYKLEQFELQDLVQFVFLFDPFFVNKDSLVVVFSENGCNHLVTLDFISNFALIIDWRSECFLTKALTTHYCAYLGHNDKPSHQFLGRMLLNAYINSLLVLSDVR